MDFAVDDYEDRVGLRHVDVTFWDDSDECVGHVLFNQVNGNLWQADVQLSTGADSLLFLMNQPLSKSASDRYKKALGIRGWMLLEKAYEIAFKKSARENPASRRKRRRRSRQ